MCVGCLPPGAPCRPVRYCPVCGEPCERVGQLIGERVCIAGHRFTFAESINKQTRDREFPGARTED